MLVVLATEVRERDLRSFAIADQAQAQVGGAALAALAGFDVPLALLAPAIADGALRRDQPGADVVDGNGFPFRVVVLAKVVGQVAGTQEAVGAEACAAFLEHDQHGQVGVALGVVAEVVAGRVEVEFLENHVGEGLGQRCVGALGGVQPEVGELGHLGVVRGDGHGLGALVAHLGEEVRVRGAGLRNVGTPGDDVVGVVPVGRLRHVGLLAPHLW
ncbi:hypothetical protein D3C76_776040 [compost metagenome]